ncbi:protoporphyrinogen oxidase [Gemmata sp. G18]|uniref:Coproporphyrinogen III oxidase n=1 Tax=Gemmata palustris TaxID=2822762 RepID=A0ABS5C6L2_9BACT|nr:protoporphyrinogen oxidase [Gemmata palustris]MBP3960748.1 protoporphyrinogen oxidase [Gemmata palustris]
MPHVIVVGGGLTGLTVAFRLKQFAPGTAVTVLEPRDRPGGNIVTEDHRGFRVECGPNGFLDRTPAIPNLVRDLGLSDRLVAASDGSRKNRYVFVGNKLHKLPSGPLGLLTTPLLSRRGKWQLLTEPWRKAPPPGTEESVQEFATRRAGKEAADVFADALVTGIHGGDPAMLSVAAAFPRLPVMEREAGSVVRGFMRAAKKRKRDAKARGEPVPGPMKMWSFREGLGVLVDGLCETLGDSVRCGVEVQTVTETASVAPWQVYDQTGYSWSADAVVLACPAYEQAVILADLDPALADEVGAIPYNRIAVVALGYRAEHCPGEHDGFGYIAPQNTRRDVLGVQWCSSIFPDRAPQGFVLWRALCGGVHRAEQVEWDDERLARAVHDEIRRAMGVTGEPVFQRIVRWPNAIPQYVIGHLDRVARIDALAAKHAGLFLTGNAYRGVAMADCVEQAEATAVRVALHLQQGANQ